MLSDTFVFNVFQHSHSETTAMCTQHGYLIGLLCSPSMATNALKLSMASGLVRPSAIISFVLIYMILNSFLEIKYSVSPPDVIPCRMQL